ncbi:MFS transporter [Streptomyces harbinensis]|uniref:Predicted arabinose efflux permease, MFS family n=1 Tax=Streptomyces harbinensis TaxID=1176198 RepID=A0A1I6PML0_9ACTN|nr:MFS transporter [Streptomyces harbinensis]SFS41457.1 Predicted arabinose efflux permease, MFS family [Streptomyces harbinensis]
MTQTVTGQLPASEGLGRPFAWLWASSAGANAGDGLVRTLLPLLVVAGHPEPGVVAGLLAVNMLPWLLFALPAGVIVDRLDKRQIMLVSNLFRTAALLGAAAAHFAFDAPLLAWFALAFALGVAETLYDTAAPAMLPAIVEDRHLERANGKLSVPQIILNEMAGPPAAGLLLGVSVGLTLFTGATLYLLAAVLLLGIARRAPVPALREESAQPPQRSVRQDIAAGLRFVAKHPALRLTLLTSALCGLVYSATFSLLVLLSTSHLGTGPTGYGLLLAAGSVGAIAGSRLTPFLTDRLGTLRVARWSLAASGAAYVALGLAPHPLVAAGALLANGVFLMGWNIPVLSLRQRLTPAAFRGRVISVARLAAWGSMPVGAALGGLLAGLTSVPAMFVIAGSVLTAGSLLLLAPLRDPEPSAPQTPGRTPA